MQLIQPPDSSLTDKMCGAPQAHQIKMNMSEHWDKSSKANMSYKGVTENEELNVNELTGT